MPGLDIATATAILKEDYRAPIREQLNSQTVLLKKLQRDVGSWAGLELYIPVHQGRNVGVGARPENATLPGAGSQTYDKLRYKGKYNYCRIQLSGPVIASMAKDKTSFARAIDSEVKGALRDSKVDVNRQMWHDGSAILTQVNDADANTTIVVQSTKFIRNGMSVDIFTSAGTSRVASGVVSAITPTQFVSSVTPGASLTTTDIVVTSGSRTAGAFATAYEMWGLEALISASDPANGITDLIGGVARASNNWHKANSLGNAGVLRPLDLDLMQQAIDATEIEGDADPGLILTNHAIKRRYAALLQSDKRYPPGGGITLDGGYRALEFDEVPLVADKDGSLTLTPQFLRRLYFLTLSTLSLEQLDDWDWMSEDGAVLSRVANTDGYEATLRVYQEFALSRANANAVLFDIDESP